MPRGRSAVSVHSDASDLDIDALAETEMRKLQRQFRIMEGDRQAHSIHSQELIRKQRLEIEKLQEEQEELQKKLNASESQARKISDSHDAQQLRTFLSRFDQLKEELERERISQAELKQEIQDFKKKLSKQKKGEVSAFDSQTYQSHLTQKASRTLENKLDRALVRFNEQMAKNSQLREELEMLRIERVRFQQLYSKLDKELQEIRRKIGDVISISTAAYDARVEAQAKMTMMKEKAVKDLAQYNAEMKELERVIAHDLCLKDFMTTKCNERSELDDAQNLNYRQEMREQRRTDSGEETVETLEEVFQMIQKETGEDDLDILVTRFIQVEDKNFALFNYVNEQNTQAEALQDEIKQIKEDIEKFRLEGLQQKQEHKATLRHVEEQQKEAEAQALEYETQTEEINKILDQIKTGVSSLFNKFYCERAVVEDLLGSSSGIRDTNIMTYLGLVEQKTNSLLTMQAFINSKNLEKDCDPKLVAQFLLGQSPDLQNQSPVIQLPVTVVDHDPEQLLPDEEDRPLTQEELRLRIMSGVLRKEEALHAEMAREARFTKLSALSSHRQHPLEATL